MSNDRRKLLRYAGLSLATATVSGCLGEDVSPFQQQGQENGRRGSPDADVSRKPEIIANNTSGVVEKTEGGEGAGNGSSEVDVDRLRNEMEVPEPLTKPGPNAADCTEATVEHTYMEKGDRVDFYNYRIENDRDGSGRVVVAVFFYNDDGEIKNSANERVFVDSYSSASGRISASPSNRKYPVYFAAVTEQACS